MKIKLKNLFRLDNKGQGLVEVFIAIYLFLVALLSIMNLVLYNIQSQNFNHNMLIASNLAREGIEIVRNIRDSNWLNPDLDTGETQWDNYLVYNHSENNGINLKETNPENSFFIFNNYVDSDEFYYSIYPMGLSWDNCIDNNFLDFGGSYIKQGGLFCRLSLIRKQEGSDIEFYSIFGVSFDEELVEETNFYRMITINEICLDNNSEIILGKNSGICEDENCYNQHCSDFSYEKIGIQVISKVAWKNLGRINIITLEDRLYDWK